MGLWVLQGRELHDVDVRQHGGALSFSGSHSSASLSGCTVSGNKAGNVSAHVELLDVGHQAPGSWSLCFVHARACKMRGMGALSAGCLAVALMVCICGRMVEQ